jgi:hypothetical protein
MKKVLFLAAFLGLATIGFSQTAKPAVTPAPATPATVAPADVAIMTWDAQAHDFGKIKQGVPVTHEFKFTNTGKVPLIITNVSASCGCTTPSWTKDPVPPGQSGSVKATFSAGAIGAFDKSVTVTANIEPGFIQLKIKGEVSAPTAVQ